MSIRSLVILVVLSPTFAIAQPKSSLGLRILGIDATVRSVSPAVRQNLDKIVSKASESIKKLRPRKRGWDEEYALKVFGCIDDALVGSGVVYPDQGLVDQLVDGLTPFKMTSDRRQSFLDQRHNARRVRTIERLHNGPFYAADCDIACFLYLSVADRLELPISMVDLPGFDQHAGHNFVRWREGAHFVNWETMGGVQMSEEHYLSGWDITPEMVAAHAAMTDMTSEQVIGYVHGLAGIQYERKGLYQKALQEQSLSLKLYPQNTVAANNYAWDTGVGKDVKARDHESAILSALHVLELVDDPNVRDTLAAVYASAGLFRLAVKEEETAVASSSSSNFRTRLQMYKDRKVYREDRAPSGADGQFKPPAEWGTIH